MSYYTYNPNESKDLPPVPPKNNEDFGYNNGYNPGYTNPNPPYPQRQSSGLPSNFMKSEDDFNFVDPNAHIDNTFKDTSFQNDGNFRPANPNLSLNNRIIYDYETDGDSDTPKGDEPGPSRPQRNVGLSNLRNGENGYGNIHSEDREFLRSNDFYSHSDLSRQGSTKSNPFKEDPFLDNRSSKRSSLIARNKNYTDSEQDSFDNIPIKPVAYAATPSMTNDNEGNAATSLLNPYRNNKFYNTESRTNNAGFRINDEFAPGELRPRYVPDPANEKPVTGLLVWRGKKIPIVCYFFTLIQIIVFIAELAKMGKLTGSPFQSQPYFNPMIGPSSYLQINMGSRFVPCMIQIPGITNLTSEVFPCPNSTTSGTGCNLASLCGLSGIPQSSTGYAPAQWYRIITPIFLHGGIIHIVCNMLLQLMLGVDMERQIGPVIFLFIYMASGISGNVFGANFSQTGISSTGASGALFGIIGVNLVHFVFFTNRTQIHPKVYRKNLFYLIFEIVFTLVLGLLPGLDNFAHIGGFIMGVLLSIVLLKDPNFVFQERYKYQRDPTDLNKSAIPARNSLNSFTPFDYDGGEENRNDRSQIHEMNNKVQKWFPNIGIRKPSVFFSWIGARVACGLLAFLWFYFLCVNFFRNGGGHCKWCKYLSCIPIKDWCTMGTIQLEQIGTNTGSILLVSFMAIVASHFKLIRYKLDKIKID